MGYIVYIAVLPNGKTYVGRTKNYSRRRSQHYAQGLFFHKALRKYDSCTWVILETGLSFAQANTLEKHYIATFTSNDPRHGYNLTEGGEGTEGYRFSGQSRQRMRDKKVGRVLSLETRRRMSEARQGNRHKTHPQGTDPKSIKVRATSKIDPQDVREYPSICACAKDIGAHPNNIYKIFNSRGHRTAAGFYIEKIAVVC